jgi:hypothetical protein
MLAEATNEPSAEKATAVTFVVCAPAAPREFQSKFHEESKTQIVPSSHPDAIRLLDEKARLVTAAGRTAVL